MMVTGCAKWYLGVLVLGEDCHSYEIGRDEDESKALAESAEQFWELVKSQTPPPVDGTASTSETLSTIYPESNDDSVSLMAYEQYLEQYVALSAQMKELDKLKEEAGNRVKAFLGEAGKGESDRYKVSWTSTERKSFDAKRFAAEHPEVDLSGYYKSSSYRTFKVTERSNKND